MSKARQLNCNGEIAAFCSRLKRIIDERFDGNGSKLARKAGLPSSTVRSYLSLKGEREPRVSALLAIARGAGVSAAWLLTGEGSAEDLGQAGSPTAATFTSMRTGQTLFGRDVDQALGGSPDWVAARAGIPPAQALLIEVAGDAMNPLLREGDIAISIVQKRFTVDGIYFYRHGAGADESHALTHLSRQQAATVEAVCENRAYPPRTFKLSAVTIIGRVLATFGRL